MPTPRSKPAKEPETPLEPDPVWDLVDKATTQPASAQFARATVQLVVSERNRSRTWWQRLLTPAPLAGLAAATAVIALVMNVDFSDQPEASNNIASFESKQAEVIQEALETEMLIAAADNPSEFSDQELVFLLGF